MTSAVATSLATAIVLAAAPAPAQPIHLFWVWLVCGLGVTAGRALERAWPAPAAAVSALVLTGFLLVWPLAVPWRTPVLPEHVDFALASAHFTSADQAMERTISLPDEWETLPVFLRIDLAKRYDGPARLRAEVNGVLVGELGPQSGGPEWEPPAGAPAWGLRVPLAVLRSAPAARVVLRPVTVDPALEVAVHPDGRITPVELSPSRFFDGVTWRTERLSADSAAPSGGAYRFWLHVR